ncbi:MAG: hypothetical protein ABWZ65_24815 [Pseudomonas mandelii]
MSDAGFNATRQNERVQEKEALYRLASHHFKVELIVKHSNHFDR